MPAKDQILYNPYTKEKLRFVQLATDTQGENCKFELWLAPGAKMPVRHLHPRQTETFEIFSGVVKVECDGEVKYLQAGDRFVIQKGKPHQWWNESETEDAYLTVSISPAYNFEIMMEQIIGICNRDGKLGFLQIMVMAKTYDMIIAGPPLFVQKVMWAVLGTLGRLMGYKKYYPEFSSGQAGKTA